MISSRTSFALLAISILSLLGAGCNSSSGTPTDQTGTPVGTQEPSDAVVANVTIPSDFPSDIPRYAKGTTVVALHTGTTYTLSQKTMDDIDTVVRNLDGQITTHGYTSKMHLGNVGEALQITDYTNTELQVMTRIQVTTNSTTKETVILIVRSSTNL